MGLPGQLGGGGGGDREKTMGLTGLLGGGGNREETMGLTGQVGGIGLWWLIPWLYLQG